MGDSPRSAYEQAVSWIFAAEAENLPAANIEAARQELVVLHAEMKAAAENLLVVMLPLASGTDRRFTLAAGRS
ncbi:hypothetical protein ACRQ5Q_21675 [Bradyrhizobium sp. PMVTL-01]|uniref:hypothetical protein n=1 Tax=Bradyrhizobium sp. PMVTL-01 TaxID=3434999 RepID=UPI003F6E499F